MEDNLEEEAFGIPYSDEPQDHFDEQVTQFLDRSNRIKKQYQIRSCCLGQSVVCCIFSLCCLLLLGPFALGYGIWGMALSSDGTGIKTTTNTCDFSSLTAFVRNLAVFGLFEAFLWLLICLNEWFIGSITLCFSFFLKRDKSGTVMAAGTTQFFVRILLVLIVFITSLLFSLYTLYGIRSWTDCEATNEIKEILENYHPFVLISFIMSMFGMSEICVLLCIICCGGVSVCCFFLCSFLFRGGFSVLNLLRRDSASRSGSLINIKEVDINLHNSEEIVIEEDDSLTDGEYQPPKPQHIFDPEDDEQLSRM